eukprot:581915-Pyramimonas_sp.AAC.1
MSCAQHLRVTECQEESAWRGHRPPKQGALRATQPAAPALKKSARHLGSTGLLGRRRAVWPQTPTRRRPPTVHREACCVESSAPLRRGASSS